MKQLTFLSDALFKYSFGKNNHQSHLLRQFLLEQVLNENYPHIQVMNPELIPEMIQQKNMILDILLENNDIRIGIDMQATAFNIHLYKRFQQYLSRLCSDQLIAGNDYASIKPAIMI
ncbi:MAG: PD-(D/E)XK nuclease family transposase, partial [Coprobacillus sp.]